MISKIDINRIAEATDIVRLVGEAVQLKPQGKDMVACCPFHTEAGPSFHVSEARQTYHCFGCGKHGDVFQWVMEHEGCNYPEAVRRLAKRANIEISEREKTAEEIARETKREAMLMTTQQVNAWFVQQLESNPTAKDYALKRWGAKGKRRDGTPADPMDYIRETGIGYAPGGNAFMQWARQQALNLDLLKELHIVCTSKDGHDYCAFYNRVTIPIRSRANQIEGWTCRDLSGRKDVGKYVNSAESELYHKKASLFGIDVAKPEIRATGKVYVAEGAPDVMRMQLIGVPNTVAPLGTAMTAEQFDLLQSCFTKQGKRTLCLLPDADVTKDDGTNPGEAAAISRGMEAVRRGYNVLIKAIPEGDEKEDPDSYFTTKSKFKEVAEQDFIVWYAHILLDGAENMEAITTGIETVAAMVASTNDETTIEGYKKSLKSVYNNPTLWNKAITKAGKAQKQKEVEEKAFSKEGFTKYGFFESGGGYWSLSGQTELRWSNFTMKPLFHIKDAINPKRLYELQNENGAKEIVELKQEDLVSLSKFRQKVEGLGNYIFEANETCLIKLKRYLYEQTQTAIEVKQLGWQRQGFYAFGNGGFYQGSFIKADGFGILSLPDGQNYYLPGASKIYKDDPQLLQFEKRFVHNEYASTPLRQVAEAMIRVFGDNAKVGLCFLIATLFRDVVTERLKSFPILNLFGPKGSGKSELGHTLMSFFIVQNTPLNIFDSTIAGLSEAVAQCANAIVHLDEFRNNTDIDKREFMKGLWDGVGRTRMNMDRDKRREQTRVDSGVIISGQEMATADIALFSRFVYLTFNKTTFTNAETAAFAELDRMRKMGFTHLTLQIINHREAFRQNFASMYAATEAEVSEAIGDSTSETRIVKNWVTLAAAFRSIETLLDLPFTYADVFKLTVEGIRRQNAVTTTSNEIGMFWRQIGRTQMEGKFTIGADYRIEYRAELKTNKMPNGIYFATAKPILFLNPDAWYQAYTYKAKDNGIMPLPDSSIIYYLENSPEYLGQYGLMRFANKTSNGQTAAGTTRKRPLCFDYNQLSLKYGLSIEVEMENLDQTDENNVF